MKRRTFNSLSLMGGAAAVVNPIFGWPKSDKQKYIRLGAPLFEKYDDPSQWISALRDLNYRAAYCPVKPGTDEKLIKAYEHAAYQHDIVIAEVGAWSNMSSADEEERRKAIEKCVKSLELAELINANCCVNVSGSRNAKYWAGPHKDNLTKDTFDLIVETTRTIIDSVKPTRTYFALEPMPWAYPDSIDNYLRLFKAIDRPKFGVHFDPVNMVVSPQHYFKNGALIREGIRKLGPYIRSCHAKDITLREDNYIPQLDECQPGLGTLNYDVFLSELAGLKDIPLMMEHLKTAAEYAAGAEYIRSIGKRNGITI